MKGHWTISPSAEIGAKIGAVKNAEPAIGALASSHAARAEGQMKANAPWNDQTGFARGSLFGRSEGTDITLGTTNGDYGHYLELGTSKMAAKPIILPTAMETAPGYFDDAGKLVMRLMAGGGA